MSSPALALARLLCALAFAAFAADAVDINAGYVEMIQATLCENITSDYVEEVVSSLSLRYYYGLGSKEYVDVPLGDADRLPNNARWHRDRCVALYIFGYLNTPSTYFSRDVIQAYLSRERHNLLLLDWSLVTHHPYAAAVALVPGAARAVAAAVDALLDGGAALCHLAGHSLGAQAAAGVARAMAHRVPHLVGLDPAGPLFYGDTQQCVQPIGAGDADCVEVIHTNAGELGAPAPAGGFDFFPNNGTRPQPGCSELDIGEEGFFCSHNRAIYFWAEAISNSAAFLGRKCSSWEDFTGGKCSKNPTVSFGRCSGDTGLYYLRTRGDEPMGMGRDGA